jgi:hypothetical protein
MTRDIQPRRATMMRSWKTLGLPAVLSLALLAAPVRGQEPVGEGDKFDKILKKLDEMAQSVAKSFEGVKKDVDALKSEVEALKSRETEANLKLQAALLRLESLERQLTRVRDERKSFFAGPGGNGALAPAGRIVLVNYYPEEMTFFVNNIPYTVAPGASATLAGQPAGMFTYEAVSPSWGSRGRQTRMLAANETFTITVR